MSEGEVENVVNKAIKEYDQETALPRHQENLGNFEKVNLRLDGLFTLVDQAKGAFKVLTWVVGLPGVITAVIVVYRLTRTH
jgi:hypothetical protein